MGNRLVIGFYQNVKVDNGFYGVFTIFILFFYWDFIAPIEFHYFSITSGGAGHLTIEYKRKEFTVYLL